MNVIALQFDIEWENKQANFDRVRRLLAAAPPRKDSLVVLPEMFATGFSMNADAIAEPYGGPTEQFLSSTAKEFGVCLVAGAAMRGRDGRARNKALVFSPGGELLAFYAKMRPFTPGGESERYTAGERAIAFRWSDWMISPFVCYDLRFPEIFREAAAAHQPHLFVVIACWPVKRIHHWVRLLQARAIENQAYVVGVNRIGSDPQFDYNGRTILVDQHGEVFADAGDHECCLSAELDLAVLLPPRVAVPGGHAFRFCEARRMTPATGKAPVKTMLRLRVTAAAETAIRTGHPWVFSDSLREQNREGRLGELAAIYDRKDRFLAIGLFDPGSPLRVRVLHAGNPVALDAAWWRERLRQALARRDRLFDDQTTGYRWINGESDGWPGLVLDRYDTTLVLKLYTAAWLPRLAEVVDLIRGVPLPLCQLKRPASTTSPESTGGFGPQDAANGLVLRLSRNVEGVARTKFKLADGQWLLGDGRNSCSAFLESGLRFEADVVRGQKTGFFLDQRDNRRMVESLAQDREVLNAFSFTGGFSVYAARGGARSVTDLDMSRYALAGSKNNFALNRHLSSIAACRHERIHADAFEWIEQGPKREFDFVILDPPSLAKRESERTRAIQAYRKLASGGIRRLKRGGILAAASCSAHVSAEEFFAAVRGEAKASLREFTELRTTGHGTDHPATFPEAHYLKCTYLKF